MTEIEFKAKGYLEKSYLDKDGGKHITFELSAKDAIEVAKLELMGRDLKNHLPILLEIKVKQDETKTGSRKATFIPNAAGVTSKDKKVF